MHEKLTHLKSTKKQTPTELNSAENELLPYGNNSSAYSNNSQWRNTKCHSPNYNYNEEEEYIEEERFNPEEEDNEEEEDDEEEEENGEEEETDKNEQGFEDRYAGNKEKFPSATEYAKLTKNLDIEMKPKDNGSTEWTLVMIHSRVERQ